jgi:hypothetical protein
MGLPAAAKKQIEDANKLHAEVYSEDKPDETPAAEPSAESEQATTEQVEPPAATEEVVTASPEAAAPAPIQKEETDWEQRYKTLQGKYNAEIPRLNNEIRDLRDLMVKMGERQEQQAHAPQAAPEVVQNKLVTQADIDDYGEDFIDVVRRVAKQEYDPVVQRLEKENEQLRNQVGGVQSGLQQTAKERLLSSLDARMPGWREINQSDEFLAWLGQYDAYSGMRRHDLLLKAFEAGDEARTIAFFEGYRNENAAMAPVDTQPLAAPRKAKVDMETLVAPGMARETKAARAQEGSAKIWTQQQISNFYDKVVAGKYRGREGEKEKRRIEADIIRAANEGRIQ